MSFLKKVFSSLFLAYAIASAIYLVCFICWANIKVYSLLPILLVSMAIISMNLIVLLFIKRINDPFAANYTFISLTFLGFSVLFYSTGFTDPVFFIVFFLVITTSIFFSNVIFVISIASVYGFLKIIAVEKYNVNHLKITVTKVLFLICISRAIVNMLKRSGIGSELLRIALKRRNELDTLHKISQTIISDKPVNEILTEIAISLGLFTKLQRSSIILVDDEMKIGTIAASFEGKHLHNRKIDLTKYPEIRKALTSREVVTIDRIKDSPLMKDVVSNMPDIGDQSIMVLPISHGLKEMGVLFLRGLRLEKGFTEEEIKFCQTVATSSAQAVLNSRLYEELKKQTEEKQQMIEQLHELNEKLQEVSRLKSAFLANVSHELRTPLTSIIGYLQLLKDNEILSREGSKYMDIILNNSGTLVKLINGLIDLAKIEAGVFDLLMEKNNLNNLVEYICDSHKPLALKKRLKLQYKMQDYEEEFFFDAKRIEQILNNLISNAIKFTPEGGEVHITTSYDNKYAIVAVKDTGIGISRKDQKIIFDRFSRVDNIDTKQYDGIGIGLHLSREIVEFHNGKIWFKSKATRGSIFYFKIPIIKNASQIDQSKTNHVIMA